MATDESTEGAGGTDIILPDAIIPDLMYRLAHNQELTAEQRAGLLNGLMMATGATAPSREEGSE